MLTFQQFNRVITVCIFGLLGLSGCYLQGSSCSGPLCISVGTEINNDDGCEFGCESDFMCPEAESVLTNSRDALNQLRQSASPNFCMDNSIQTTASQAPLMVTWSDGLFAVADRHARDMAANNFVNEIGSDGISIDMRVEELDYSPVYVTQLVAGGFANSRALIDEWARQPDECRKLLAPEVTQFSLACSRNQNSDFGTYWSLVLASE